MITLSDNIYASVPLPLDDKNINIVLDSNTIIVEEIEQYLSRVDMLSRYLGQEVPILTPPGIYDANDFIIRVNTELITWKKYGFVHGIEDLDFIPIVCQCEGTGPGEITEKWVIDEANCLKSNGVNTGWEIATEIKQILDTNGNWVSLDPQVMRQMTYYDTTACPATVWTETSRYCQVSGGWNTGYLTINEKEQIFNGSSWVDTGATRVRQALDTNSCPITPYGAWSSVDLTSYDYATEINIPFTFGQEVSFVNNSKIGNIYLFLSIPYGHNFTLKNSFGIIAPERFISINTESRLGYRTNNIYKLDTPFGGQNPVHFTLKIDN